MDDSSFPTKEAPILDERNYYMRSLAQRSIHDHFLRLGVDPKNNGIPEQFHTKSEITGMLFGYHDLTYTIITQAFPFFPTPVDFDSDFVISNEWVERISNIANFLCNTKICLLGFYRCYSSAEESHFSKSLFVKKTFDEVLSEFRTKKAGVYIKHYKEICSDMEPICLIMSMHSSGNFIKSQNLYRYSISEQRSECSIVFLDESNDFDTSFDMDSPLEILDILVRADFLNSSSMDVVGSPYENNWHYYKRLYCEPPKGPLIYNTIRRNRYFRVQIEWPHDQALLARNVSVFSPGGQHQEISVARELYQQRRYPEAIAAFKRVLRTDFYNAEAHSNIASMLKGGLPKDLNIGRFYGENLERLFQLEAHYLHSITAEPAKNPDIKNRNKILDLVDQADNRVLESVWKSRKQFSLVPRSIPTLQQTSLDMFYEEIYNTCAIEGNSFSFDEVKEVLKSSGSSNNSTALSNISEDKRREWAEIIGVRNAIKHLTLNPLKLGSVSVEDIMAINKILMVEEVGEKNLPGEFRLSDDEGIIDEEVTFGEFMGVPAANISSEMNNFVSFLNESYQIDCIELAALAHLFLVGIHPFSDGNGRTSRLVMNSILRQNGFPSIIIPFEDMPGYFAVISEGLRGNRRSFIRYIVQKVYDTLERLISSGFGYYAQIHEKIFSEQIELQKNMKKNSCL